MRLGSWLCHVYKWVQWNSGNKSRKKQNAVFIKGQRLSGEQIEAFSNCRAKLFLQELVETNTELKGEVILYFIRFFWSNLFIPNNDTGIGFTRLLSVRFLLQMSGLKVSPCNSKYLDFDQDSNILLWCVEQLTTSYVKTNPSGLNNNCALYHGTNLHMMLAVWTLLSHLRVD